MEDVYSHFLVRGSDPWKQRSQLFLWFKILLVLRFVLHRLCHHHNFFCYSERYHQNSINDMINRLIQLLLSQVRTEELVHRLSESRIIRSAARMTALLYLRGKDAILGGKDNKLNKFIKEVKNEAEKKNRN